MKKLKVTKAIDMALVPAGSKTKHLSWITHTTKAIHHHHHDHHHDHQENELVVTTVFPFDNTWIYDQPNNSSMSDKIKILQYKSVLAITGAIRGSSKETLHQDIGLESWRNRRQLRRMSYVYKIILTKLPPYLYVLIPPPQRTHC